MQDPLRKDHTLQVSEEAIFPLGAPMDPVTNTSSMRLRVEVPPHLKVALLDPRGNLRSVHQGVPVLLLPPGCTLQALPA